MIILLILFSVISPFLLETTFLKMGLRDLQFFLLLIPSFILSYYLGLKGGLFFVIVTDTLFLWQEWFGERALVHERHETYVIFVIAILNVVITIGIGLLADKFRKIEEDLRLLTVTDPLTNLFNRRFINNKLLELPKDNKAAMLVINLDRFKYINDTLNHEVGDELLRFIAERLKGTVENGWVARDGGDEFVILITNDVESTKIIDLANQIRSSIAEPYIVKGNKLNLTASIGISIYPDDAGSFDMLLKNADLAMYHAKDLGKNQIQLYVKEMQDKYKEEMQLEQDLYGALEGNQFVLYYQPKFKIKTREIVGLEALIRWNHPRIGLISPLTFIPIAEEISLIVPIGEWVIRSVCYQLREWKSKGIQPPRTAVNISARQFNLELVDTIKGILVETHTEPNLLEIEITESILMENIEDSIHLLKQLSDLGIRIAIDDFGTGYSSLSYLKNLPIHSLKIDKSFIDDIIKDVNIVSAIISLANNLHLDVIAEGIEEETQLYYLELLNCLYGQGYLVSPPITAFEIEENYLKNGILT